MGTIFLKTEIFQKSADIISNYQLPEKTTLTKEHIINNIKSSYCKLLLKSEFISRIRENNSDIKIRIIPQKQMIKLFGNQESILAVQSEVDEIKCLINEKTIVLSVYKGLFYEKCSEFIEYLLFDVHKITVVYEIEDNKLKLLSLSKDDLQNSLDILQNEIVEFKIKHEIFRILKDESTTFFNDIYQIIQQSLKPDCVFMTLVEEEKENFVKLVTHKSLCNQITKQFLTLFKNCEISKVLEDLSSNDLYYIKNHKINEFDYVKAFLGQRNVKVSISSVEQNSLVAKYCGKVNNFVSFQQFMKDILLNKDKLKFDFTSHTKERKDTTNTSYINVEIGSILDESKKYDCLIVASNTCLDLNKGKLSKLILDKAGNVVQKELKNKYPKGITKTEIAVSSGGNLKNVKHILYTGISMWDKENQIKLKEEYRNLIKKVLTEANFRACRNIALPAIGSGILCYPHELVAKWMYEAIDEYFISSKNNQIERVNIILFENDIKTIDAFSKRSSEEKRQPIQKITSLRSKDNLNVPTVKINQLKYSVNRKLVILRFESLNDAKEDVIVNTKSLNGPVLRSVINIGDEELRKKISQETLINGFIWSSALNLACQEILHINLNGNSIKVTVAEILKLVEDRKYSSVALPVFDSFLIREAPVKGSITEISQEILEFVKNSKFIETISIYLDNKEYFVYFKEFFDLVSPPRLQNPNGLEKSYVLCESTDIISYEIIDNFNEHVIQKLQNIFEDNFCEHRIDAIKKEILIRGLKPYVKYCKEGVYNLFREEIYCQFKNKMESNLVQSDNENIMAGRLFPSNTQKEKDSLLE